MKIYEGLQQARKEEREDKSGIVLTIGNFDGVHLGHQSLIAAAQEMARELDAQAGLLTFWPHPARILAPSRAPALIRSRSRRREILEETGLDLLIEHPFSKDFASLPAEEFLRILFDDLGVLGVVVGYDFTYGKARGGNVDTLKAACDERGLSLKVVPPVTVDGAPVSSSRIRERVESGDVATALELLGRPFELEGLVVHGAGRGHGIGVPTANLEPQRELVPAKGVYATRVLLPDNRIVAGACNVGVNPTFLPSTGDERAAPLSVEVHVMDYSGNLYGSKLRLFFVEHLRPELRFADVDSLVAQMRLDIEKCREILADKD